MAIVKRKKIYYIPGIISLIILPLTFLYYANKEITSRFFGVLPINIADTNLSKDSPEVFQIFRSSFLPKRNYIDIILTGNNQNDKTKLDFAQIRIREILTQNDSINALHFTFGDNSEFWTFVKGVDILRLEGAKTYMPLDGNLWFYHFPPDTTIVNWICGTTYNDVFIDKPKVSWWTKATKWTIDIWRRSWEIISAFIIFLFSIFVWAFQFRQTNNARQMKKQ